MNEQFLIDNTIPYLECFLREEHSCYSFAMMMDKMELQKICFLYQPAYK